MDISRFDFFAANAPNEIPFWFEYKEPNAPQRPKSFDELGLDEEGADYSIVREWYQGEQYITLPDHLKFFGESWQKYWDEKVAYDLRQKINAYFAWRIYYADRMCQLEKQHL